MSKNLQGKIKIINTYYEMRKYFKFGRSTTNNRQTVRKLRRSKQKDVDLGKWEHMEDCMTNILGAIKKLIEDVS